jgi:hypothetical protein
MYLLNLYVEACGRSLLGVTDKLPTHMANAVCGTNVSTLGVHLSGEDDAQRSGPGTTDLTSCRIRGASLAIYRRVTSCRRADCKGLKWGLPANDFKREDQSGGG